MAVNIDIDNIATDLNGKADRDLTNVVGAMSESAKNYFSGAGMPSGNYIDLTLGASGTTYTAPANGWVYIGRTATASGQMVSLTAQIASRVYSTASGQYLQAFTPVAEGNTFTATYSAPTAGTFRFVYAEGEN